MHAYKKYFCCFNLLFIFYTATAQPIDRKRLVERHKVTNMKFDSLSSLSVGNGSFAFTVDVTGLQSFPDAYQNGIPLGTQSEWGWHSFTDTMNYKFEESLKEYDLNGRKISYAVQWNEPLRNKNAGNWFRQNPHRLQLGNIGFEILKKDRTIATINDIKNINQQLNMWTGEIKSHFTVEDMPVDVSTLVNQSNDMVSVEVRSSLLQQGRLLIRIRLPYPTGDFTDFGNNWKNESRHQSSVNTSSENNATIRHQLDSTLYFILLNWNGKAVIEKKEPHYYLLKPSGSNTFRFNCLFSQKNKSINISYQQTKTINSTVWKSFWTKGAAVDFSGQY
jgi:hypothetical protein